MQVSERALRDREQSLGNGGEITDSVLLKALDKAYAEYTRSGESIHSARLSLAVEVGIIVALYRKRGNR